MLSMKSIRNVVFSALLTLGAFGTVFYTSCTKDACKDVVCKNGGTCVNGTCSCPYAFNGTNCETEVRSTYYNTYKGNGTDSDGDTYTGWSLKFYKVGDDPKTMGMDLLTNVNMPVASLTVTLQSATTFNVVAQTVSGTTFTGSGSVNTTSASLTLVATETGNVTTFTFTNMNKQ
jgi:hypothetical protein